MKKLFLLTLVVLLPVSALAQPQSPPKPPSMSRPLTPYQAPIPAPSHSDSQQFNNSSTLVYDQNGYAGMAVPNGGGGVIFYPAQRGLIALPEE